MNTIPGISQGITPASQAGATSASAGTRPKPEEFAAALTEARVKVSRHAQERLDRRGIQISPDQAGRLGSAIDRAAAKGSRTSLVLLNELALLVRIPERVVVTAMTPQAMRDGVVTQIDSAVVI